MARVIKHGRKRTIQLTPLAEWALTRCGMDVSGKVERGNALVDAVQICLLEPGHLGTCNPGRAA